MPAHAVFNEEHSTKLRYTISIGVDLQGILCSTGLFHSLQNTQATVLPGIIAHRRPMVNAPMILGGTVLYKLKTRV